MTAPRGDGTFSQQMPRDTVAPDAMDFGGRLELGGTGVDLLEEMRAKQEHAENLTELLRLQVEALRIQAEKQKAQSLAIAQRYGGIARRIEAEVGEVRARLPPNVEPAVAVSLSVILDLLSLIQQAATAAAAAAAEGQGS